MIFDDGSTLAEHAADYRASLEQLEIDRARLEDYIREAHAKGRSKMDIHRETGISRPTINAWLAP